MTTTLQTPSQAAPMPDRTKPIIEVRNAGKIYAVNDKRLTVFENMSYEIPERSFLSIIGPSGCGKSTLLKLISGLEPASSGQILFKGRSITGPADGMIYVFQQYSKSIFPWRTVIQNIDFGLQSHKKLPRKEARDRCMDYIKLVGLEGYEDYYPYQLSGGMQQRVVIARALICEPAVLLMDEPFSAVDALTRAILQELILKIWQTIPVTILFVTMSRKRSSCRAASSRSPSRRRASTRMSPSTSPIRATSFTPARRTASMRSASNSSPASSCRRRASRR